MTVDERRRYALFEAARRQLGEDEATALMELLPPLGWADVATKRDLGAFHSRFEAIDNRFEAMEHRFDSMEHRFDSMEHRFDSIDSRLEAIGHRFEGTEHRFDSIGHRFDAIDHRLDGLGFRLEAGLHAQTNRLLMWLVPLVVASTAMSATIAAAV